MIGGVFRLARFEFLNLLQQWPIRLLLAAFLLWPLLTLELSASRPSFQAQALRESLGLLYLYILPILAAGLGASSLQSTMVRSILTAPLSRSGLALSRFFSRALILLCSILAVGASYSIATNFVSNADLLKESKPQKLELLETSKVSKHSASSRKWLAWDKGVPANLDLALISPPTNASLVIPYIATRNTGEIGKTSRKWLEGQWREPGGEWQILEDIKASSAQARISLPVAGKDIELRLQSRRAALALGVSLDTIVIQSIGGSDVQSLALFMLHSMSLTLAMLAIGMAASARFSAPTALVATTGFFFLAIFGSSIGFSDGPERRSSVHEILVQEAESEAESDSGVQLSEWMLSAGAPAAMLRFEREGIEIDPKLMLSDPKLLRTSLYLLIALALALLLMREREFVGDERT